MQIEAADTVVNISPQKLVDALNDARKSAKIVRTYVSDSCDGIVRVKYGRSFIYKRGVKRLPIVKHFPVSAAW
ncbi:hypothetical protein LWM68_41740 [Niabella sp. W65]|nr:hypothetical protein [Niabella sp. W65]MCH7368690.1 hypothetical protein [Niabella sp. W65]